MAIFPASTAAEPARKEQAAAIAFTSTANRAAGVDTNCSRFPGRGRTKASWESERLAAFVRVNASSLSLIDIGGGLAMGVGPPKAHEASIIYGGRLCWLTSLEPNHR